MDAKTYFKSKLSSILFLEMKKERIEQIFNFNLNSKENIYIPIATDSIIKKVNNGEDVESIPVGFFIEGMFYVLGADEGFKYNDEYKSLIKSTPKAIEYIKGRIAENIKNKSYEDGYLMLRGLSFIDKSREIYDKLILMLENLRVSNNIYLEEEIYILEEAKSIEGYLEPYFYESIIKKDKEDYDGALFAINTFISKGGKETPEVLDLKNSLKMINDYDKAKAIVYDKPEKAIAILLPLLESLGDKPEVYYYIAIAYRILENYEKAIYYLEQSMEIDNSYAEVFNELGINYACLEDFKTAIVYLRKVFEVTKSIEVCTNLVMCYINLGDYKQAKLHLDIAKKLDDKDEIVNQLDNILKEVK